MDNLISFCAKYQIVPVIWGFLAVIFIIAKRRTLVYNGPWETKRGKGYTYTDQVTGTTFISWTRILMPGILSRSRQKFGKASWSLLLTVLWLAVIAMFIYSLS